MPNLWDWIASHQLAPIGSSGFEILRAREVNPNVVAGYALYGQRNDLNQLLNRKGFVVTEDGLLLISVDLDAVANGAITEAAFCLRPIPLRSIAHIERLHMFHFTPEHGFINKQSLQVTVRFKAEAQMEIPLVIPAPGIDEDSKEYMTFCTALANLPL